MNSPCVLEVSVFPSWKMGTIMVFQGPEEIQKECGSWGHLQIYRLIELEDDAVQTNLLILQLRRLRPKERKGFA